MGCEVVGGEAWVDFWVVGREGGVGDSGQQKPKAKPKCPFIFFLNSRNSIT